MTGSPGSVESRVRRQLTVLTGERPPSILVALSGGCDSVVLLYLLRFPLSDAVASVCAAHLDHAMRPASHADAEWVHGLCRAWEVPLRTERLSRTPRSEEEAREERYRFLREAAAARGGAFIATGHHADDQAETVLFRAVRGTGLAGLTGIAPRANDLIRPLLGIWRDELRTYAAARRLAWRTDETNETLDPARNRLRNEIIPELERWVAPGTRRSLVSLAKIAAEAEEALQRLARAAEAELVDWEGGVPSLARGRLHLYDSAVTSRVLRNLLRHFGVVPGRSGTRRALQFITDAESGRRMPLSAGLQIEVEFDRAWFRPVVGATEDRDHRIASPEESGEADVRIGGSTYRIHYGPDRRGCATGTSDDTWTCRFDLRSLAFPLSIRGWRDGDRMRTQEGRRSLKKIFLERRVPRARRRMLPLLVDASGEVVCVFGLASDRPAGPSASAEAFLVRVSHD